MAEYSNPLSAVASLLDSKCLADECQSTFQKSTIIDSMSQIPSVKLVQDTFGINNILSSLLLLVVLPEQFPQYQVYFGGSSEGNKNSCYPSIEQLLSIICKDAQEINDVRMLLDLNSSLFIWKLLILEEGPDSYLHRSVRPHKYLLNHFIYSEKTTVDQDEYGCIHLVSSPIFTMVLHQDYQSPPKFCFLQIYGQSDFDRQRHAFEIAKQHDKVVYQFNNEVWQSYDQPLVVLGDILRLTSLKNGILYWPNGLMDLTHLPLATRLLAEWVSLGANQVIFSSDNTVDWPMEFGMMSIVNIALKRQSVKELAQVWRSVAFYYLGDNVDINWLKVASISDLTLKSIVQTCIYFRALSTKVTTDCIIKRFEDSNRVSMSKFAIRVESNWILDDLILPVATRKDLTDIYSCIHGERDGDLIRFNHKNIVSLFWGLPGTGKTIAVEALANALKLPLYKVNLANIASKWIGETEKNLDELFLFAEKTPCILFFDEADGLFSKRTLVDNQQDKSSNLGISYLLQRVERFSGFLILATNYKSNLDSAFLRRLHYSVYFPMPDSEGRLDHWRKSLMGQAKTLNVLVDCSISLEKISEQYVLSGANISRVCERAFVRARGVGVAGSNIDYKKSVLTQEMLQGILDKEMQTQRNDSDDMNFIQQWKQSRTNPYYRVSHKL